MRTFRKIPLLLKISLTGMLFVITAFWFSGKLLMDKADSFIEDKVEHDFFHKKEAVLKELKEGEIPEDTRDIIVRKVPADYRISRTEEKPVVFDDKYEGYTLYRIKQEVVKVDGDYFLLTIRKHIDEVVALKEDVKNSLITIFTWVLIVFVVFNLLLSYIIFRPFRKTLDQMKKFRLGQSNKIKRTKTSTSEFSLMQEMFHQMVRRSEEDYRHLKEYTENMAHELQTPLAIIRNKTENLMNDSRVMENQAETVKVIYDETNHLSGLGKALRLLTKIENNEYVNSETICTKEVLEKKVGSVEELAGLKNIAFKTDLSETHTFVIDPFLLDIVLKNLIRNAILYSPEGSCIEIETGESFFRISNVGKPVPGGEEGLFKRFTGKHNERGSLGLGLAIVKTVCDLNGLKITYNWNEPLHTFTITTNSE